MSSKRAFLAVLAFILFSAGLFACGGSYDVGGVVLGLDPGDEVVLENKGADDLAVNMDGAFIFPTKIDDGDQYEVTVLNTPEQKYCTVSNKGVGTMSGAEVLDVEVACWEKWNWDGTVWLAAGQSNMEASDIFAGTDADVGVLTYSAFKEGDYTRHDWQPLTEGTSFSVVGGNFAIDLSKALSERVHIVAVAEGSTPVSCWITSGDCFDRNVRQFAEQRFDGVIWWQGETEALQLFETEPELYEEQFEELIWQWRDYFHDPDLPFFVVELQHYQEEPQTKEPYSWAVVRAAQYEIAETVPNVFIIPSVDITPEGCLHPSHVYRQIGSRLANETAEYLKH